MKDRYINQLISKVGFDYDENQKIYFSRTDAWQKNFGYFAIYDEASPFSSMFIHCEPILFKYDNRDWKIEFWKGQYGISTGAEVGIYTGAFNVGHPLIDHTLRQLKAKDTACAEKNDWLQMSMVLKKGRNIIFTRNSDDPNTASKLELHWWLTGFKPGVTHNASELVCEITLHLKDIDMAKAFVGGLKALGYKEKEYDVDENTVKVIFGKPYYPQPLSHYPERLQLTQKAVVDFIAKIYPSVEDFSVENLGYWLLEKYKLSNEDAVKVLYSLRFSINEVGQYFYDILKRNARKLADLLFASKYRQKEIFDFLHEQLKIADGSLFQIFIDAGVTLKTLKRYFNSSDNNFAVLMHSKGYLLDQIGNFFGDNLSKNAGQVLIILNNTGFAKDKILKFIENKFTMAWNDILALWVQKIGW